jgi:hypothetical protein
MPKKKAKSGKPQVHEDLEGFEMNINEFGEIKSNVDIERLNLFLNKNVKDKKLKDRDDLDVVRDEEGAEGSVEEEEDKLFDDDELPDLDVSLDEETGDLKDDEDY